MSATPTDLPAPDAGLRLVVPSRRVPVGDSWDWIVRGWRLFARAPLMWVLSFLLFILVALAMGIVPFVGQLVFQVLNAVIAAGFVYACRSLERGGDFELEHLFYGFRTRFASLVVVGLLLLAGQLVIMGIFLVIAGFPLAGAILSGNEQQLLARLVEAIVPVLLGILVALALLVPLAAAFWFAPALVAMHGLAPIEAMKQSLVGCLRNFWGFTVYGIILALFALLIPLTLGLGMFVWVPVAIASSYAAYRDIYTEEAAAGAAQAPLA
jgi:uncharacterized membrane protein